MNMKISKMVSEVTIQYSDYKIETIINNKSSKELDLILKGEIFHDMDFEISHDISKKIPEISAEHIFKDKEMSSNAEFNSLKETILLKPNLYFIVESIEVIPSLDIKSYDIKDLKISVFSKDIFEINCNNDNINILTIPSQNSIINYETVLSKQNYFENDLKKRDLCFAKTLSLLPEDTYELDELILSSLSNHNFTEISDKVSKQKNLKTLIFEDNNINDILSNLVQMPKLKQLQLRNDPMKNVKTQLKKLINDNLYKAIFDNLKKNAVNTKNNRSKDTVPETENDNEETLELEKGKQIQIVAGDSTHKVFVINRPNLTKSQVVYFIVRNIQFSNETLKSFIKLQEQLHKNECDNRKSLTIGTHNLATVKFLLKYCSNAYTGRELSERLLKCADAERKTEKRAYPTGVHQYLHLTDIDSTQAIVEDSEGTVVSFPPLTNCRRQVGNFVFCGLCRASSISHTLKYRMLISLTLKQLTPLKAVNTPYDPTFSILKSPTMLNDFNLAKIKENPLIPLLHKCIKPKKNKNTLEFDNYDDSDSNCLQNILILFFKFNNFVFQLRIRNYKSIHTLKQKISKIAKIKTSYFEICYNGMFLSQDKLMSHYNLLNLSTLVIFLRLQGGSDDKPSLPPLTVNTFSQHLQYPKPVKYFLDEFQSPETWFLMIETSFPDRKLTSPREKFNFILPLVPTEIIAKLSFTIKTTTSPSCEDPYNIFKKALLRDIMPTKSELFNRYFKTQTLGNVLPSKFLAKCISDLENLQTDSSKDESTLRHFFLSALPIQTQQILSILTTATIQELALSADRMTEVTQTPNIPIASISPKVAESFNTSEMTNAIVALTKKINNLES